MIRSTRSDCRYLGGTVASLDLYLIKPTRYDDDGYPVQWWRSLIPSNSLAAVAGLVRDALDRGVLEDVGDVRMTNSARSRAEAEAMVS